MSHELNRAPMYGEAPRSPRDALIEAPHQIGGTILPVHEPAREDASAIQLVLGRYGYAILPALCVHCRQPLSSGEHLPVEECAGCRHPDQHHPYEAAWW